VVDECWVRRGRAHRLHDACLELAKAFDYGHVLNQKGPGRRLALVATNDGIPIVDPELGGAVGWDEASIRAGVDGVHNVFHHYGLLPETAELRPQTRARGFEYYITETAGLLDIVPDPGDRVSRGDTLFRVTGPFGQVRDEMTADTSGVFWRPALP